MKWSYFTLSNIRHTDRIYLVIETCQTRMTLSVYPEYNVWPSADQASETHCGTNRSFGLAISALSSSTTILCSKSYFIEFIRKRMNVYSNSMSLKGSLKYWIGRLTQILMELPVAAQSQYLFGEKQRALMLSPLSKVYKCLLSFKSHNMAWPSLPPDAQSEPSGETVTVFK